MGASPLRTPPQDTLSRPAHAAITKATDGGGGFKQQTFISHVCGGWKVRVPVWWGSRLADGLLLTVFLDGGREIVALVSLLYKDADPIVVAPLS